MMPTHKKIWFWSFDAPQTVDFDAVYREQMPRIYNYFRYRFGDDALAEDLTADTFTRAWQNRQKYRRDLSAFSTWLYTIARRVAIDQFRRGRVTVPLDDSLPARDTRSPEEISELGDDLVHLEALLSRLTDRDRELVALKYGAGLTNRAISGLVGLTEANVAVILYRVVVQIRTRWENCDE
jgi:RNA polymerase sigma-70 factor, ECF subfamily